MTERASALPSLHPIGARALVPAYAHQSRDLAHHLRRASRCCRHDQVLTLIVRARFGPPAAPSTAASTTTRPPVALLRRAIATAPGLVPIQPRRAGSRRRLEGRPRHLPSAPSGACSAPPRPGGRRGRGGASRRERSYVAGVKSGAAVWVSSR